MSHELFKFHELFMNSGPYELFIFMNSRPYDYSYS